MSQLSLESLSKHDYIRPRLEDMQKLSEAKSNQDLETTDKVSKYIMDIAEFLEKMYTSFDMHYLVDEVCGNVVKLLKLKHLNMYCYIVYEILPPKYKNQNKNSYKDFMREENLNTARTNIKSLSEIEYTQFNINDVIDLKKSLHDLEEQYNEILYANGVDPNEIREYNQLEKLKKLEKERFPKASVGKPVASVEELIAKHGTDYKSAFDFMKINGEKLIKVVQIMVHTFVEEYPPVNPETCVRVGDSFEVLAELCRPFADRKYRLDHYKALYLALLKQEHTSQKASRESRVLCANFTDKEGRLVYRSTTKEQIEASFEWEINFMRKAVTTIINFGKNLHDAWAENGERAMADRAVALSGSLSHHA
jgi:hypothetical protein